VFSGSASPVWSNAARRWPRDALPSPSRIRVTNALRAFVISDMPVLGLGRSSAGSLGERLEEAAPVAFSVKDATHLITTRPVKVETAMLELDARSVLAVGDEAQLEFRLQTWVVLPVRGDLPIEHQTRVRFPTRRRCPSHTCFHRHRARTSAPRPAA